MGSPSYEMTERTLETAITQSGQSVTALSHLRPVMLVFLRHFG